MFRHWGDWPELATLRRGVVIPANAGAARLRWRS